LLEGLGHLGSPCSPGHRGAAPGTAWAPFVARLCKRVHSRATVFWSCRVDLGHLGRPGLLGRPVHSRRLPCGPMPPLASL